ncbi:MAG: hypothetical protein HRT99_02210 [Mycoplasmatales bacterium]|nr:hypothetical protein [Mycoplasmatales bacterium]
MANKNYNDIKLSKYFLKKSRNNEQIPFMTIISKELGISNATVSRYAKKKGYYNFGEMRAKFNRTLDIGYESFDDKNLEKFLRYKRIVIDSSISTHVIRDFLIGRLSFLPSYIEKGINVEEKYNNETLTVFITITGESNKIKTLLENLKNPILIITTNKIKYLCDKENITQIELNNFKPVLINNYDINNSIINIMKWLNDVINIYQLKMENEK